MLCAIEHSRGLNCRYYYPGYAYREASMRLQEALRRAGVPGLDRRMAAFARETGRFHPGRPARDMRIAAAFTEYRRRVRPNP
jgi:hypothetical protein